ncbi:tetratricopeptide repeat protein, partial [Aerosakkonemataceae cyanobacterium BLCC-F154]
MSRLRVFAVSLMFAIASTLPLGETTPTILNTIAQTTTNQERQAEADRLYQLAEQQYRQSQFREALGNFEQALVIYREIGNKAEEAPTLHNIALVYDNLGQHRKALELFSQALAISKEVGDKVGEGTTLVSIGLVYDNLGQHRKALELFSQALAIFTEVGDKAGEGTTLQNIGNVYNYLAEYPKAIDFYQQALAIFTEVGDKAGEGTTLVGIGLVYYNLGEYPKAIDFYQQALAIFRRVDDKAEEGTTLNNIGQVYRNLGEYPKALDFFSPALAIYRQVGDKAGEGTILQNIGTVYRNLGEYPKALNFYQQALAIFTEVGNKAGEGTTLVGIGQVYDNLEKYRKAMNFYQQALAIHRQVGNKAEEGRTLNNIGQVYRNLGEHRKAMDFLNQALAIHRQVGNKAEEGLTLDNIGEVYDKLGEHGKAMDLFSQALAISKEVGDKVGEGETLNNIGLILNKQNQPELAIVFYKQSVNVIETIRQDLRKLPQEQQKSYTKTVASTYRDLANLLLGQGRILEAQQVLELLKIQEIRDYTRNAKASNQTSGIDLNSIEEQIIKTHGSLIAFGQKVAECRKSKCSELSQLNDQLQALITQYNQSIATLKQIIANRRAQDQQVLDPNDFGRKAREITAAQPGTVLIYPFVVADKTWLLLAAEGGVLKSIEVPVSRRELGETVLKFRQLLQQPNSNLQELKATSKQLYDWLIKPLESEIKGNKKVTNLVFSLDRVTRYIPMAALFDGEKYLIENYSVSTILSAGLTDVSSRLPPGTSNTPVLGLGLSNAVAGFNPLPNVLAEVDMVVRENDADKNGIYPGLAFL